jgi:hypothetical protein
MKYSTIQLFLMSVRLNAVPLPLLISLVSFSFLLFLLELLLNLLHPLLQVFIPVLILR